MLVPAATGEPGSGSAFDGAAGAGPEGAAALGVAAGEVTACVIDVLVVVQPAGDEEAEASAPVGSLAVDLVLVQVDRVVVDVAGPDAVSGEAVVADGLVVWAAETCRVCDVAVPDDAVEVEVVDVVEVVDDVVDVVASEVAVPPEDCCVLVEPSAVVVVDGCPEDGCGSVCVVASAANAWCARAVMPA